MNLLRELKAGERKARRGVRKASKIDLGDVFLVAGGLGLVGGAIWLFSRSTSNVSFAPNPVTTTPPGTTPLTWKTASVVPNGASFALMMTNATPAAVAELQALANSLPGAVITVPGQGPPPGWPIPNDGGGTTAVRIFATNNSGSDSTAMASTPGATLWVQS